MKSKSLINDATKAATDAINNINESQPLMMTLNQLLLPVFKISRMSLFQALDDAKKNANFKRLMML
jgi:hypothetical protein